MEIKEEMITDAYGECIQYAHPTKIDVLWFVLPSLGMISYC